MKTEKIASTCMTKKVPKYLFNRYKILNFDRDNSNQSQCGTDHETHCGLGQ